MIGIKMITESNHRWMVAALVLGGLAVAVLALVVLINPSSETAATASKPKPAEVVKIEGSEFSSVTLLDTAAERLGIDTVVVAEAEAVREGSAGTLAVPYGAILYDAKGNAFVYTVTAALSFVRAPIVVDYVEGDQAILSEGPPSGTEIVAVGAAELYGAETGVK